MTFYGTRVYEQFFDTVSQVLNNKILGERLKFMRRTPTDHIKNLPPSFPKFLPKNLIIRG